MLRKSMEDFFLNPNQVSRCLKRNSVWGENHVNEINSRLDNAKNKELDIAKETIQIETEDWVKLRSLLSWMEKSKFDEN